MASIFSKIIAGEIPSYRIAEDDKHYAFLDINPLAEGHTLVVPKREVDYIFDLSDSEFAELQLFAKRVAEAIRATMPCKRVGVAVIGLEVPHAHIHLDFRREKLKPAPERMAEIASSIAENFK